MRKLVWVLSLTLALAAGAWAPAQAQLDTLKPKWVVNKYFEYATLSPDENTILARRLGGTDNPDTLYLFNADNGNLIKQYTYDGKYGFVFFSQDSKQIVYNVTNYIIIQNIATGILDSINIKDLLGLPSDFFFFPTEKADEYAFFYYSDSAGKMEIARISSENRKVLSKINITPGTMGPEFWFSPDYKYIAFNQQEEENGKLYEKSYVISTDSMKLVYESEKDNKLLYINFSKDSKYGIKRDGWDSTDIMEMKDFAIFKKIIRGTGFFTKSGTLLNLFSYIDKPKYQIFNFSTNALIAEFTASYMPGEGQRVFVSDLKNQFYLLTALGLVCFSQPETGIEMSSPAGSDVRCAPNPTDNTLAVDFSWPAAEEVSLDILDNSGRVVKHLEKITASEAKNSLKIDLQGVAAGSYFVRIKGTIVKTTKLMITK